MRPWPRSTESSLTAKSSQFNCRVKRRTRIEKQGYSPAWASNRVLRASCQEWAWKKMWSLPRLAVKQPPHRISRWTCPAVQPISFKKRKRRSQTMTYRFDQNRVMRTAMRWRLRASPIWMMIRVTAATVIRRSIKLTALSSTINSPSVAKLQLATLGKEDQMLSLKWTASSRSPAMLIDQTAMQCCPAVTASRWCQSLEESAKR